MYTMKYLMLGMAIGIFALIAVNPPLQSDPVKDPIILSGGDRGTGGINEGFEGGVKISDTDLEKLDPDYFLNGPGGN
jgi:hypothetical protein